MTIEYPKFINKKNHGWSLENWQCKLKGRCSVLVKWKKYAIYQRKLQNLNKISICVLSISDRQMLVGTGIYSLHQT